MNDAAGGQNTHGTPEHNPDADTASGGPPEEPDHTVEQPSTTDPDLRADDDDPPTGGDQTTEDQLDADNPAEEETLKTLEPDAPSS